MKLRAIPAYWSLAPSLESQIEVLVKVGYKQIGILPYFLFAGGITDAIAENVKQLQGQFPQVQMSLGHPIGGSQELANMIFKLLIGKSYE